MSLDWPVSPHYQISQSFAISARFDAAYYSSNSSPSATVPQSF